MRKDDLYALVMAVVWGNLKNAYAEPRFMIAADITERILTHAHERCGGVGQINWGRDKAGGDWGDGRTEA